MDYNVISDSCMDFNDKLFNDKYEVKRIPFKINIDGSEYTDTNKKVVNLLEKINFKAKKITTACPSPADFCDAVNEAKNTFIITVSSKLSGSYQSAVMAKEMIQQEFHDKFKVHIFDSQSAATGQDLIALRLKELIDKNLPYQEIVDNVNNYIGKMKTLFSLESLDTLVSNGRVNVAKQYLTKAFSLFPILQAKDGKIEMDTFARGKNNVMSKLVESIGQYGKDFSDRVIGITHINALDKAEHVKEEIKKLYNFKDVLIFEGGGLSSVYASNRGIILAF